MIGANALKNPVTIKQPVIEDRNLRGALIVIFAINKNFHFRISAAYCKKPVEANVNLNRGTGGAQLDAVANFSLSANGVGGEGRGEVARFKFKSPRLRLRPASARPASPLPARAGKRESAAVPSCARTGIPAGEI
jgi:hypothetical protein